MLANTMSLAPKIDEIRTLALEFNLDLVCVTETWLRETISDNSIQISRWGTCAQASLGFQILGYFLLRRDRFSDSHGGVCIYISEQIQYEHLIDYQSVGEEVLWVKLRPNRLPPGMSCILIGIIYQPRKVTMRPYKGICVRRYRPSKTNC